ncbi:hypothetical protein ACFLQM_02180 [Acidobacteriota bacterium]
MTEKANNNLGTEHSAERKDAEPKKPYEPPQLVSQQVMEAIAAACLPEPPGKGIDQCPVQTS